MWYLLKVDALIGVFVFSAAGLFILAMLAWEEAKAYAAARHRIYKRLAAFVTEPHVFANSFVISRRASRFDDREHAVSHRLQ
jgi:hypothetical protein